MSIRVTCQSCSASFAVGDRYAGKRGKCPKCGDIFRIPAQPPGGNSGTSDTPPKGIPVGSAKPAAARQVAPQGKPAPAQGSSVIRAAAPTGPPPGGSGSPTDLGFLDTPAPATASGGDMVSKYRQKHKNDLKVPVWVWFATAGAALFGLLAYVAYDYQRGNDPVVAKAADRSKKATNSKNATKVANKNGEINRAQFMPEVVEAKAPDRPSEGASVQDVYDYIEHGVVLVEAYNSANQQTGTGSGFVINKDGLIVTNYHVVEQAYKAEVVFNSGKRCGIEGYMACAPEFDLAVLKLNVIPSDMVPLDIEYVGVPRKLDKVIAIGHPLGNEFAPFDGRVTRVVQSSELSDEAQRFLQYLGPSNDHTWIEHRTGIAPGNSGGPLVDYQGRVLGVNTWVSGQLDVGYAIHVQHVRYIAANLFAEPEPIHKHRNRSSQPSGGGRGDGQLPVTVDSLKEAFGEATEEGWAATSNKQYSNLQVLARSLTFAKFAYENTDPSNPVADKLKELSDTANELIAEFKAHDWTAIEKTQRKEINEYAQRAIDSPLGVYFFGTVTRAVTNASGDSGAFLDIQGTETVKIYLDGVKDLKTGQQVVVLGMSVGMVDYGDDPLNRKRAFRVVTKCVAPADE